jgi:peptidoglycan/LPS O-acetylase OafA/YrhL
LTNPFLAVDFFFVLSGFVIFHAYEEKLLHRLTASEYLARRLSRLYTLMAVGLLGGLPVLYMRTVSTPSDYTSYDLVSTLATNLAMSPYMSTKTQLVDHVRHNVGLFPSDTPLSSISF